MAQEVQIIIKAQNLASSEIDKVKSGLKAMGIEGKVAFDNMANSTDKLRHAIKEERQESRLRNFVIKENAAALGKLSETFVGPSGLISGAQKAAGSLFEMDFAIESLGIAGEKMGGRFGSMLGSLAGVAVPISIAIGGFALIKEWLDADTEAIQKYTEKHKEYLIAVGDITPLQLLEEEQKKLAELQHELAEGPTFWERVEAGIKGTLGAQFMYNSLLADQLEKQGKVEEQTLKVKAAAEKELKVEKDKSSEMEKQFNALMDLTTARARLAMIDASEIEQKRAQSAFINKDVQILEMQLDHAKKYKENASVIYGLEAKIAQKRYEQAALNKEIVALMEAETKSLKVINALDLRGKKAPEKVKAEVPAILNPVVYDTTVSKIQDVQVSFEDMFGLLWQQSGGFTGAFISSLDVISSSIENDIGNAFESVFGEANSLLEKFVQNLVVKLGSNLFQSAIGGLISLIPGGGFLSGLFGGIFHEGGTVPKAHDGMFIDAPPSKEFPILVRGGETIRTEAQEAALQGKTSGGHVTINFNGNGWNEDSVVRAIEKKLKQTGLSIDELVVRSNNSLVIA